MAGIAVIRYTSNPADFTLVDGVIVDEQRPPGGILGIPGNKVCCIAQFERGPVDELLSFGSTDQLRKTMGDIGPDASGNYYEGALSLRGKKWGRIYVIRVSNSTMDTAAVSLDDSTVPTNVLDVTADSLGNWGNSLKVSIEDATSGVSTEFDMVIKRNGVIVERHRNLDLSDVADGKNLPITSDYVIATRIAIGDGRPVNVADQALTGGTDGTFADTDYVGVPDTDVRGIQIAYGDAASDIRWVFCGEQTSSTINDALEDLATNGTVKNVLIAGSKTNTAAQAITDVANYRSDRIGYCYPHVKINVPEANNGTGGLVDVSPASFAVNVLAAMAPGQNPAGPNGVPYLKGIKGLVNPNLTNANYEDFRQQRIMAFQFTKEAQDYEIRSGITTSLDSALANWSRRNMADYIQLSGSQYLVSFRNKRINKENKLQIKVALTDFLDYQIRQELLPSDADLNDFRPPGTEKLQTYEIDITNANSPEQEAEGIFIVSVRVRIHPTMDFLVFRTEIGERVEITPSGF